MENSLPDSPESGGVNSEHVGDYFQQQFNKHL